ncbi:hypothetical protein GQ53DRAFT_891661 [Thozetella sp. PMI_491]|nr:hypothetical protein GQ53DRAFT_891661 [Thozetella sp. PMI_491]
MGGSGVEDTPRGLYGRACVSCSQGKCKCVRSPEGGSCMRCRRLGKQCKSASFSRRAKAKTAARSRVAKIEQKLDGLVALLHSQTGYQHGSTALPGGIEASAASIGVQLAIEASSGNHRTLPILTPTSVASCSPGLSGQTSSEPLSAFSPASALSLPYLGYRPNFPSHDPNQTLHFFRSRILPSFPFIYIPPSTTAEALHQSYPLLWLCIVSLTTLSLEAKTALSDTIRETLAQRIVLQHMRSLDLLLACLCYLGWLHHNTKDNAHLRVWTQLAMTIAVELRLAQSPASSPNHATYTPTVNIFDEQRALLSTYILSSMLVFATLEPLRWSPSMEESLQELINNPQWEGDNMLTTQVRLHLVIDQLPSVSQGERDRGKSRPEATSVATVLARTLRAQLQEIERGLPLELRDNKVTLLFLRSTSLWVAEMELDLLAPGCAVATTELLSCTQRCLDDLDAWFHTFFAMPCVALSELPFAVVYHQLARQTCLLRKLSTLKVPGHDRDAVIQRINPSYVMERIATGLDGLRGLVISNSQEDSINMAATHVRVAQGVWEEGIRVSSTVVHGLAPGSFGILEGYDEASFTYSLNNEWLGETLGAWSA